MSTKDEEVARVHEFLTRVAGTTNRVEQGATAAELFTYLSSTNEVLKNAGFRRVVKAKMLEFISIPDIYPIIKDSVRLLCEKLLTYESGPIDSCLPSDHKILGAGGFGAVFSPALPNNIAGASVNYPGNVTKMFYRKNNLNTAMNTIGRLPAIMGENKGHRAHRYSRKYKGKNLPPSLYRNLKTKNPDMEKDIELYLMRMPDLGTDIENITNVYKEVRNRPFQHILTQIQKVIHQTAKMASNKYAHFDIRTSNVMITPSTGDITIVDFDWLKKYDDLYDEYPLGFFSNPPECVFVEDLPLYGPMPTDAAINTFFSYSTYVSKIDKYESSVISKLSIWIKSLGLTDELLLHDAVQKANIQNYKYLKSKGYDNTKKLIVEQVFPFVDNYGLGFTLLEFISVVYPYAYGTAGVVINKSVLASRITNNGAPYTDGELNTIIAALKATIALLIRMSSFVLETRPTPSEAAAEIDAIFSAAYPIASINTTANNAAADNNARRELTRLAFLAGDRNVMRNSRRKSRKSRKSRK